MKKIYYILGLILLTGCGKDIFIDIPDHDPKIVVNGLLEADSTFKIYVSKTRTTGKNEPLTFLKDATVDLYHNGSLIEKLQFTEAVSPLDTLYYFNSTIKPVIGDNYSVKVSAGNFPDVEGNTHIPIPVPISKVLLKDIIRNNENFSKTATVEISFKDPEFEKNYYHIIVYTVFEPPYLRSIGYTSNDIYGVSAAYNQSLFDYSYLWDDIYFSGLDKKITISFDALPMDAVYKFELRTVSKEYYNYHQTLYLQQENSSGPFGEPINVYSNIKNGYGILAGFSAVSDTIFIPE